MLTDIKRTKIEYVLGLKLGIDISKTPPLLLEGFYKSYDYGTGILLEEEDIWDRMFHEQDKGNGDIYHPGSEKYQILIAIYWNHGYSGEAWILLQDKMETKTLFEIENSHCSCNGLRLDGTIEENIKLSSLKYLESNYFNKEYKERINDLLKGPETDQDPATFYDLIEYIIEKTNERD